LKDRIKKITIFFAKISTRFAQVAIPQPAEKPLNRTSKLGNSIGALE
jgi:hypothetical protein